ncbi:hypothetical protein Poli38472_003594 [Pythium oligandrum]|uniref:Protein kinase domain-containing protein n=1 Tax=Pythium oligandrum TaxID=41045 RepID=A0A8K1CLP8_PYTOL|nr:hypothetical protein Poli38472_003594 [Pythium oligandrum]|eukprot:TMW65829.1 hypothetical protein Poli38472_003594 [Pythium oligandrum]
MEIPLKELSDKLIWRYNDAPYVFGYAAVGYQVSLVLIRKDATDPRGAFAEVIEEYDLSEHNGRLTFFLALLNLSTLFRPVLQLIRPLTIPEYGVEVRQNGVELYFGKDSVIKEYPASMPSGSIIKKLATLHTLMAKHRVPNVVTLVKSSMKKKRVELKPIGRAEPPSDLKQLLTALCDILTALVALHSIGVMHRDLRWENVIKYENGPDKWFLIDFDDARRTR